MKIKFFLLGALAIFSVNTRAAQEGESTREITISNKLLSAVRIYSDPAPKNTGKGKYVINSIDEDVLPNGETKEYSIKGNVVYYSPLIFESLDYDTLQESRENGGCSDWLECEVLTGKEKKITVSEGTNEITLEEQA